MLKRVWMHDRPAIARKGACLAALLLLSACGPRTVFSLLFPERYSVTSTIEVIKEAGIWRQALTTGCSVVDQSDSIAQNYHVAADGDPHWVKRKDGSILVLGDLSPCMWTEAPALGTRKDLVQLAKRPGRWPRRLPPSYLFDSAVAPTKVDLLDTNRLIGSSAARPLKLAELTVTDAPPDYGLANAFPGLRTLKGARGRREWGVGAVIEPGTFIGIAARVTKLVPGTTCGTKSKGPVVLQPGNLCGFIIDCTAPTENRKCGKSVGSFRVNPDPDFSRMVVDTSSLDDRYIMTLYDSELPEFSLAMQTLVGTRRLWKPKICLLTECVSLEGGTVTANLYIPEQDLVVEIRIEYATYSPDMFDHT